MNIPIHTAKTGLSDFVFRAADRMRIDGCANAVAREGLSLALYCPHETLLDHYTGLLLHRLRQQAPEHSIEVYFPANTDSLLSRFNESLSGQSIHEATKTPQGTRQAQIWIVHDAHKLPEAEIQLLARLIQNFPGANIRAILLLSGKETTKSPLSAFGRKILRWDIEAPTDEQAQTALELARSEGHFGAVQQLLQSMQRRPQAPLAVADFETRTSDIPAAKADAKTSALPAHQRITAFQQHGIKSLRAAWLSTKALAKAPQWIRQNTRLSMALASALVASTLITLWLQPETFGLNSLKNNKAPSAKALTMPAASPPTPDTSTIQAKAQDGKNAPTPAEVSRGLAPAPAVPLQTTPVIEAPEAALQAQSWVRALDPDSFVVQHGTSNTYEKILELKRKFSGLKDSQIVAAYRPGEKLAHFVLVSGPFSPITQGYEAAKRSGIPPSWVRSTRNLQEQLKAPSSVMDTPR